MQPLIVPTLLVDWAVQRHAWLGKASAISPPVKPQMWAVLSLLVACLWFLEKNPDMTCFSVCLVLPEFFSKVLLILTRSPALTAA